MRLAASAHLAIFADHIAVRRRTACEAILEGYRAGVEAGGRPFVLEETHGWLRRVGHRRAAPPDAVLGEDERAADRARHRSEAAAMPSPRAMPAGDSPIRFARRVAGMGSLGRPRFVGIADWRGGCVAREAKATAPSAWLWASETAGGR